jgi:hypothetical protein
MCVRWRDGGGVVRACVRAWRGVARYRSFVFLYLRVMVGSWFLACMGMLEIVLSIPTAVFLLRFICGVNYFAGLNMLCIFIVSAIGADDIFVFMDAYRQSAFEARVSRASLARFSRVFRATSVVWLV